MGSEARCWSCGYDVTGCQLGSPCPECGRRIEVERDVLDHRAAIGRRSRLIGACALVAAFVLLFEGCRLVCLP